MRTPSSISAIVKIALVLMLLAGAGTLIRAARNSEFTVHDKAYYADATMVSFIRPGLSLEITSASIATDGTIKAHVKITDPKGLPLDREGILTPGTMSVSLIAATIPQGQKQYTAYTFRNSVSTINGKSAVQATGENNGTWTKTADGEYDYIFKTKAPQGYNRSATHTIGVYGSRNLSEFDMGTQYDSHVFNFVPDGSPVTVTRDVIRDASCNRCHDQLAFHGGSRRGIELCNLCHTPQTTDPDTGNTVDMPVMTHKIHMGSQLTKPYQIIGHGNATSDWSSVTFPADARRCEVCHDQKTGAKQATAYLNPTQAACGACHDSVDFATGLNHANMPQVSNNLCGGCHIPQGELEFDASIKGAHVVPVDSAEIPGVNIELLKVENNLAGQAPKLTFTVKDNKGNGIPLNQLGRLNFVLAGPTADYGYTKFGTATTTGYVSESGLTASVCAGDGTCAYSFTNKIPADAKGTYTIGAESRRTAILQAGMVTQQSVNYGAKNKVINFAVDGSTVAPRRTIVAIEKCNACHQSLSLHGGNRNQIEQCVLCHNPSTTDAGNRVNAREAADKLLPPQGVNMALMIHKIHTGEELAENGQTYIVVGNGGSHNDFSEVRYPAFSPSGSPGDRRNCSMCHVNGSEQAALTPGLNKVTDPQGLLNPAGSRTSACTSCHGSIAAASHALINTSVLGESCDVCHGANADFSVNRSHAR